MKQGILIVSRGTTDGGLRERYLTELRLSVEDRFPSAVVAEAFTNGDIRKKLRDATGEKIPGVKAAMLDMRERGVTDLVVMSTHVAAGVDYGRMSSDISSCGSLFHRLRVARPLIELEQDFDLAARSLYSCFGDRTEDGSLLIVARGAENDDLDESFEKLEESCRRYFKKGVYVATLDGKRGLLHVLKDMINDGREGKVLIVPFMFVLDELRDYIFGDENTIEARLRARGYETECIDTGLGEFDEFHRLLLKHLYDAVM